ncbi:hypothetical protein NM688_g1458 [Phlebia brevispora]|uniref:Uncharacterized protein n=1 Tax=Phlebia brevispora TaxID=194682 RepID=A0ACC1TBE9_9APHY|nr:hypothetical protein NM688_g1458 [Phlebia brevispora]
MSDTQHDPSTTGRTRGLERLEVEDEEERQQRMHDIFMQLDNKQSQPRSPEIPRAFDFGDRRTFMIEPPTELLSRVQAFLPQLAASNADITRRAKEDPASVDIEKLGSDGRYIQMNLGLGVFEQHKGASRPRSSDSDTEMHDGETSATSSYSSSSPRSESDSTDDSDTDSDDSVDIISSTMATLASRPIRPLPRRKKASPHIVMLGEGNLAAKRAYSPGENQ